MHETSPAFGGALVGVAMLFALVYSMGYSHQFSDVMSVFGAHLGDWLVAVCDTVRQTIGALL